MNTKRRPRRARQARHARAEVTTIFEVDEYNTVRQRGVPEPETHADLYPDVDPSDIRNVDDAVLLLERHPGAAARVQQLIQDELDEARAALVRLPPGSSRRVRAQARVDHLAEQVDEWSDWVRALRSEQLEPVREAVAAWLGESIDWGYCEAPVHAGSQGEALSHFEQLPLDLLKELGIELVYGEHPGSTYYAAELKGDLDRANAVAAENGLDFRFMREGEELEGDAQGSNRAAQAEGQAATRTTQAVEACSATEAEPASEPPMDAAMRMVRPDMAGFKPLFGGSPDNAWMKQVHEHDAVPPAELRHLHFPWLFQMAWRRIVETIREPVQSYTDAEGRRHVHVLRSAVYTIEPSGLMLGFIWRPHSNQDPVLESMTPWTMTVDMLPWRWRWLEHWQYAFEFEVSALAAAERAPVDRQAVQAYARWAFALFRGRIRRGCDLRVMRRRIARVMALDPLALAVARQLCLTERRSPAMMAMYNRAVEHLAAHRKLEHDAPRLHLTHAVLCHFRDELLSKEPADDEPLQRLRRRVKAHGLSSRVYRHLLQGGAAIWRPMMRFYAHGDADAAWDYLALIDTMGWKGLPDAAFMQLVLAQCGSTDMRRSLYAALYHREMRVLRRLVQRYEGLEESGRAQMREELPRVLTWLGQKEAQPVREAPRVPGWTTLVKQARAFELDRMRVVELDGRPWAAITLEGVSADPTYEVVLLANAQALRDEGRAMRHCALSYGNACAAGNAAVVSVRDRQTGQRVATALWKRSEQGWTLDEVVGFANGPVSTRVRKLILLRRPEAGSI